MPIHHGRRRWFTERPWNGDEFDEICPGATLAVARRVTAKHLILYALSMFTIVGNSGCATMLTAALTRDPNATAAVALTEVAILSAAAEQQPAPPPPTEAVPTVYVHDTLPRHPDRRLVRAAIRRHRHEIDACRPHIPDPKATWDASVVVVLTPDGAPDEVVFEGPEAPALAECVIKEVSTWRFPESREPTTIRFAARWMAYASEPT